jgi:transcription elongation factor/antiterminator RfaH
MSGDKFVDLGQSTKMPSGESTDQMTLGQPSHWYAAYTKSRHEKHVQKQFERRSIESFLPLYQTIHRWKDRRTPVQLPLFPGYIFVRFGLSRRLDVLQIAGVVCLVRFNGRASMIQDEEIEALRMSLSRGLRAVPHPYLARGRRVRIKEGALAGFEGILVRRNGNIRVVLSIDLLKRSIAVDADIADLELLPELRGPSAPHHLPCVSHQRI